MATIPNPSTLSVGAILTAAQANAWTDGIDFLVGNGSNTSPIVSVRQTVSQSIPASTWAAVTMDTETLDTDGMHSTSSNTSRLTVVTPGWYLVQGVAGFAADTVGVRQVGLRVNLTGSSGSTEGQVNGNAVGGGQPTAKPCSALVQMAAGDWIELVVRQTSGGALDTETTLTEFQSRLVAFWVRAS